MIMFEIEDALILNGTKIENTRYDHVLEMISVKSSWDLGWFFPGLKSQLIFVMLLNIALVYMIH